MSMRLIYARGFPYGAPLVMIRGGATRQPGIKEFLKREGFQWNSQRYAWEHYLNRRELGKLLVTLRDQYGCEIRPKDGMDAAYLLDLQHPKFTAPIHQHANELRLKERNG